MIIENDILNTIPFLDIFAKINGPEFQGIFGFVFYPNYTANGYIYVHYLILGNEFSRYFRFTRSHTDPNISDNNTEQIIYEVPYSRNGHRSGDLNFEPDGYLYISTGDGPPGAKGSIGDVDENAQNLHPFLVKYCELM